MRQVFINRTRSGTHGTFGEFRIDDPDSGEPICYTGEPSWKNNGPDSCIPPGTYICIPHNSPAHPNTWEITDVPDRTAILIHTGNAPEKDSLGCVLVGENLGTVNGLPAVLGSVNALKALKNLLPPTFQITITENLA